MRVTILAYYMTNEPVLPTHQIPSKHVKSTGLMEFTLFYYLIFQNEKTNILKQ